MILNGVTYLLLLTFIMISIFGYSFEMFWWIELNAGEITASNTN